MPFYYCFRCKVRFFSSNRCPRCGRITEGKASRAENKAVLEAFQACSRPIPGPFQADSKNSRPRKEDLCTPSSGLVAWFSDEQE